MYLTQSQRFFDDVRRVLDARRSRFLLVPMLAGLGLAAVAVAAVAAASAVPPLRQADIAAFTAENDAAMDKMMKDMHVPSSGNVDRDFAVMMIPHHQGAIDMALAQLRYGRNDRLKRLASEIIIEQREEIRVMQAVLKDELPVSSLQPRP
jgi:hypothetical protein